MLDDDHRIAGFEQLAQRAHQLGDVVEVQASGRLVEQKQRAARGCRLPAAGGAFGGPREETGQLQPLGLAARQGRHRLAEFHVFEPHVDDRLQRADHVAIVREQQSRFTHREVQHVRHVHHAGLECADRLALDRHLEDLRPVALAVAVRAAQVDIGEKLHLDVLEAGAATGRTPAIAAVETELGAGVAALPRQRRDGKDFAHRIPGADVAHRVGARGLADRRLVDEHHVAQMIGAQQAVVLPRRFGRLAEVTRQCRRQHVLDQAGLA